MAHPILIITDPGIDGAFAVTLAMSDPHFEVVGLAATAGNVTSEQATQNVHVLIEQLDPGRWPRVGTALPIEYEVNGRHLHGPTGFGNASFPAARMHHPHYSDKLIVDLVRQFPKEVTIVVIAPLTALARALDRDNELPHLVHRIICLGGAWHETGNASAAAEFHFYCDPAAARQVLRSGAPITLVPLDVARKLLFSPSDLLELPAPESRACKFLSQIVPYGIRASANHYGVEGFYLKDVLGIFAARHPAALTTRALPVDVETRGELTRGMSVVDARPEHKGKPNVELATGVDVQAVRSYIRSVLSEAV